MGPEKKEEKKTFEKKTTLDTTAAASSQPAYAKKKLSSLTERDLKRSKICRSTSPRACCTAFEKNQHPATPRMETRFLMMKISLLVKRHFRDFKEMSI
jgi:hypothetical protein